MGTTASPALEILEGGTRRRNLLSSGEQFATGFVPVADDTQDMLSFLPSPASLSTAAKPAGRVHFWWVNQRQNFELEARGRILRAPLHDLGGLKSECYANVARLRPGDIIVHHVAGLIRAIGVVAHFSVEIKDPLGLTPGRIHVGGVNYFPLKNPVAVADLPLEWRLAERKRENLIVRGTTLKRRPFDCHGIPHQGYLFGLSEAFVSLLLENPASALADAFDRALAAQRTEKEAC